MNNDVIFILFLGIGDKNHFFLNFRNYQVKLPKVFLLSHRSVNTARLLVDGHQHTYVWLPCLHRGLEGKRRLRGLLVWGWAHDKTGDIWRAIKCPQGGKDPLDATYCCVPESSGCSWTFMPPHACFNSTRKAASRKLAPEERGRRLEFPGCQLNFGKH